MLPALGCQNVFVAVLQQLTGAMVASAPVDFVKRPNLLIDSNGRHNEKY